MCAFHNFIALHGLQTPETKNDSSKISYNHEIVSIMQCIILVNIFASLSYFLMALGISHHMPGYFGGALNVSHVCEWVSVTPILITVHCKLI